MSNKNTIDGISRYFDERKATDGELATEIDGLVLLRNSEKTDLQCMLYQPSVCLVLQGSKETHIGDKCMTFSAGESVIVSHTSPVVARIVKGSRSHPYVAMVLELDVGTLRSLINDIDDAPDNGRSVSAVTPGRADEAFIDAMSRLFALLRNPVEAKVLAPLVIQEIHYRLLVAKHGNMLRELLDRGSYGSRIWKVITRIKTDYASTLTVSDLADSVGMSASTFHEHFKAVTRQTPLQFQKDLRLLEARRLLISGAASISNAAFEVGYESPNQFSREYSRKFGWSPRTDVSRAKALG